MPIAAQLFASSFARATSQSLKQNHDPSSAFAASDQSFSDALQAASQSSNSNTQSAPPPPPAQSSASSVNSSEDDADAKAEASSDTTTQDTTTTDTAPTEPTAHPVATDSPDESSPKTPIKNKPTDPLTPASPDLAAQAALTALLPTHIPLPKAKTQKQPASTDTPVLAAAPQSPLKPLPHPAKTSKNNITPQDASKSTDPLKTPVLTADATLLSQEPIPATEADVDPNAQNTSNTPAKSLLAIKPDSNITPTSVAPNASQSPNAEAATLAAANAELTPITKPAIPTLESTSPSSPTDASSASLAINAPPPLTSHAAHAQSASAAQDLPRTDPSQTYDQIVLGLRTKLDANNQTAEIHLNPPNLGSLHVSIQLANGSLTASFNSQSEVVRDLLKSNMDKLKSVLQDQGIAVDKLNVNTVANSSQSSPDRNPNSGSAPHDGRSAGYTQQDSSNQKRSAKDPNTNSFARAWKNATKDNPIDLVA